MAIASAKAISPVIGSEISFPAFAFRMIMRRRASRSISLSRIMASSVGRQPVKSAAR